MENNQTSPATGPAVCPHCRRAARPGLTTAEEPACGLCPLVDEAWEAVGQILLRHFPQARYGDLSPGRTLALTTALEGAIEEWIDNNVPPNRHGSAA